MNVVDDLKKVEIINNHNIYVFVRSNFVKILMHI